ncbi:ABC transporter permease [Kutzneria viridogrisea]|uniref:Oligopeptide transport system permease protein OppC n=2 Tax=Kutzneria TaxID=43356 RepID=W5W7V3_9PSEU|nr:ABC transporter permease [Kutzneria albida]AHH94299.1 ABC transporter inner membrane protein [Kutzneria albida DSM 43870]MBA8929963.1 peptide/nickel transport system permease protein [Kutzneria viridogrisea]
MTDATIATTGATPAPNSGTSQFDSDSARSQWKVVLKRFMRHRAAVAGSALFILLVLFAFFGSYVWKYSYQQLNLGRYLPPSADHPFGTGHLGEDMLSQIIRGTQFSLQIAIIVAVVATFIGVILGAVSGYRRGWVDSLINRGIDLVLVLPPFVIAAAMTRSTFLLEATKTGSQSSNWLLVAIFISLISWMSIARTVRAMVLSLREKEFVEAARALGGSTPRIVFRHILPNTIDVIIVNTTVTIAQAVLLEAALSFIGLGVQSPDTSLGLLINQNKNELTQHPWLFFIPFAFIVAISLSVNFIGDGMRDAFDPRQRRVKA